MAQESWVIELRHDRWRVWADDPDRGEPIDEVVLKDEQNDASYEEAVKQLADTLTKHGYTGEGLALVLPSDGCLCAGIDVEGLPRRQARSAMLYRLEEKLPVAAEQVMADFIVGEKHALGICLLTEKWSPVINAFKSAGIAVELISPAAILALQHHAETGPGDGCDAVLWTDGQRLELFTLDRGTPVRWNTMPAETGDLEVHLRVLAAGCDAPLRVALQAPALPDLTRRVEAVPGCQAISSVDAAMDVAAVRAAGRAMTGRQPAWVNFCHGPLAAAGPVGQLRVPLKAAVAAGLVLWVCLTGAMWWRAHGYQAIAAQHESTQATLYQELFPGQAVPLNVKSRLSSEHRRLAGVRKGDQASLPAPASVLPLLHSVLKGMPTNTRYTVLELQLDENSLYIEGQVNTHGSADTIATAVKQHTGWDIQPPRTEKLGSGGIGFTVRGTAAGLGAEGAR